MALNRRPTKSARSPGFTSGKASREFAEAAAAKQRSRPSGAGTPANPNGEQNNEATQPSSGLDADKHAAAQRIAHQAEGLRQAFVPGCMAAAFERNGLFDATAFRAYLDQFLRDAGDPHDPVERALLEQFAFAHLRLADLQSLAAGAKTAETTKVYSAAAARLFAELRRTAIARQVARDRTPTPAPKPRLHRAG